MANFGGRAFTSHVSDGRPCGCAGFSPDGCMRQISLDLPRAERVSCPLPTGPALQVFPWCLWAGAQPWTVVGGAGGHPALEAGELGSVAPESSGRAIRPPVLTQSTGGARPVQPHGSVLCWLDSAELWLPFLGEGTVSPYKPPSFQYQRLQFSKGSGRDSPSPELVAGEPVKRSKRVLHVAVWEGDSPRVSPALGRAPVSHGHRQGSPVGWRPGHGCREGGSQQAW